MKNLKILLLLGVNILLFGCTTKTKSSEEQSLDSTKVENGSPEYLNIENTDSISLSSNEDDENINTKFSYSDFDIIFYNYSFQETRRNENRSEPIYPSGQEDTLQINFKEKNGEFFLLPKFDTLKLVEDVFYDLDTTLVKIIPKNTSDDFKIFISLKQNLREQFDNRNFITADGKYTKNYNEAYDKWEPNSVKWEGWTSYREISASLKYNFRMPLIREKDYLSNVKKKLNLRDTIVTMRTIGENDGEDVANLVYKNKACRFDISDAIIKIERYKNNKLVETKYITIWFTSGC